MSDLFFNPGPNYLRGIFFEMWVKVCFHPLFVSDLKCTELTLLQSRECFLLYTFFFAATPWEQTSSDQLGGCIAHLRRLAKDYKVYY